MGDRGGQSQEEGRARRAIVARGLPYFAVFVDLVRHPKVTELEALVGPGPAALGYLVALWSFAAEFYGDGCIPDRPAVVASFERMARWSGEAGGLVAALIDAGFLDRTAHALTVHDWAEYQSPHVARRERERAKKRRNRANRKGTRPGDNGGDGPGDMDGTRHVEGEGEGEGDREAVPASAGAASTAQAQALWEAYRDKLSDRIGVPRDWLRVANAERAPQVREQLDTEIARLGMARAVEVGAEAFVKAKSKPRWLAYLVGPLQDARRSEHHREAWEGESPQGPRTEEWPEPTPEQVAEWEAQAKAEMDAGRG